MTSTKMRPHKPMLAEWTSEILSLSLSLSLITQSSTCGKAYTYACGEAGGNGGPAQLAANETPCEISKSSATLQCSWGLPASIGL